MPPSPRPLSWPANKAEEDADASEDASEHARDAARWEAEGLTLDGAAV